MLGPFLDAYHTLSPTRLGREWTALLTVPGEGYWQTHADFGRPLAAPGAPGASAALVGGSRSADMVVNILLTQRTVTHWLHCLIASTCRYVWS
jgi:hypothetical protein